MSHNLDLDGQNVLKMCLLLSLNRACLKVRRLRKKFVETTNFLVKMTNFLKSASIFTPNLPYDLDPNPGIWN